VLIREILICGAAVLALSLASDRLYFGFWTFPPHKWLYFNLSQALAVFYGRMPWHYYLSQGVPLLTTTFLPFCVIGLWKAFASPQKLPNSQSSVLRTLSLVSAGMILLLSLISHKEVRFIYPLLPIFHIAGAPYITSFFTKEPTASSPQSTSSPVSLRHKHTLAYILSINLFLAGYLSLFHQSAPLSVVEFLRTDFERLHPNVLAISNHDNHSKNVSDSTELFALFLTPCHSTPWRSHLVYPALRARALTCEPPLNTAPGSAERNAYLDEADRFYLAAPDGEYGVRFLAEEMWPAKGNGRAGEIPRYIVGFEGVEGVLKRFFEGEDAPGKDMGVKLRRVWAARNGWFNEDWRRRGSLVVWDTGVYEGSYGGGF
jgi:phosphatidylinositol glycan class B